jgi:hypothetical protein
MNTKLNDSARFCTAIHHPVPYSSKCRRSETSPPFRDKSGCFGTSRLIPGQVSLFRDKSVVLGHFMIWDKSGYPVRDSRMMHLMITEPMSPSRRAYSGHSSSAVSLRFGSRLHSSSSMNPLFSLKGAMGFDHSRLGIKLV